MIEAINLKRSFGDEEILRGVSLTIEEKEQVVIQGASGSGKSTLLYILGGIDKPDSGSLKVLGKDMLTLSDKDLSLMRNKNIGFVFQFHFLLPQMTCWENILLPAQVGGGNMKEVKGYALELAQRLKVEHCLDKLPTEISGGEQQRINIVRALSQKPQLLLCDEPTGNLDSKNSERVVELLNEVCINDGLTLIMVTHDTRIASQYNRKIVIEDGQIIS